MKATKQHDEILTAEAGIRNKEIRYFVPVDFSKCSYHALRYALTLAKASFGSIDLFHVTDANEVTESGNPVAVNRSLSRLEMKAKTRMQSLGEIIAETGVAVVSNKTAIGHVKSELIASIRTIKPDIIVVGKGKDTIFKKDVLSYLVKYSNCPILVVPDSATPKAPANVVLASDLKPVADNALNPFFEIVQRTSRGLSVLNINRKVNAKNGEIRNNPWGNKINSQFDITVDFIQHQNQHIVTGIFDYIEAHQTDLLCAVKRSSGGLSNFFHHSLSLELAKKLQVPVLLVPEAKQ